MTEFFIASSVLIVLFLTIRRGFWGRIPPQLQYALWLVVAARLLLPFPLPESPFSVLNVSTRDAAAAASAAAEISSGEPPVRVAPLPLANTHPVFPEKENHWQAGSPSVSESTEQAWTALWIAGTAGILFVQCVGNLRLYRLFRRRRNRLSGADCPVPVYTVPALPSPCLFFGKIYLPETTDPEDLPYILAHELSHRRHGDPFWTFLRNTLCAVYWFHPLVWVAAFAARQDCELCCDASAIASLGESRRKAYGAALIRLAERGRDVPLYPAMSMLTGKKAIARRIQMIAKAPRRTWKTLLPLAAALLLAAGCTFTGAEMPDGSREAPGTASVSSVGGADGPASVTTKVSHQTIAALFDTLAADPSPDSSPQTCIDAHPETYQQLISYDLDTLAYCCEQFEAGGQTDLSGHLMAAVCRGILGGEDIKSVSSNGQEWYDALRNHAVYLTTLNSPEFMQESYPYTYFLLTQTGLLPAADTAEMLDTDCITIYEPRSQNQTRRYRITDPDTIQSILKPLKAGRIQFVPLSQTVPSEPLYYVDFGKGLCYGVSGDYGNVYAANNASPETFSEYYSSFVSFYRSSAACSSDVIFPSGFFDAVNQAAVCCPWDDISQIPSMTEEEAACLSSTFRGEIAGETE